MLTGIGIDIVSLAKMSRLCQRHGARLEEDFLTPRERQRLAQITDDASDSVGVFAQRRLRYVASRFAAKEAAVKALGGPHRVAYDWNEIEISGDTGFTVELHGRLRQLAETRGCNRLTGSFDAGGVVCIAVVLGESI